MKPSRSRRRDASSPRKGEDGRGSPSGPSSRLSPEAFTARRDALEAKLARYVSAWAKLYETCPLAGCRRNRRCLKAGSCRAVSREPVTDAERLEIGRRIREAMVLVRDQRASSSPP